MGDGGFLVVKNLVVQVNNKAVLKSVNLRVESGEVVALTGVNGSGKSSLAMTLLGSDVYQVKKGSIFFNKTDLLELGVEERVRHGLLVAWQNPITVPGVTVFSLAKAAYEVKGYKIQSLVEFKQRIEQLLTRVGFTKEVVSRSINDGFSGGEKKRLELFWILLLEPKLVVMDELDSGLDVGGRDLVIEIIQELRVKNCAVIVITHYPELLNTIKPDRIMEMRNGRIVKDEKVENEQLSK